MKMKLEQKLPLLFTTEQPVELNGKQVQKATHSEANGLVVWLDLLSPVIPPKFRRRLTRRFEGLTVEFEPLYHYEGEKLYLLLPFPKTKDSEEPYWATCEEFMDYLNDEGWIYVRVQ